jgi:hypothetical protein
VVAARLLAEDAEPGVDEHRHRRPVGGDVDGVLARPVGCGPPVDDLPERPVDRLDGGVEHAHEVVVRHVCTVLRTVPP